MTPAEMKANMAVFKTVEIETDAIRRESGEEMAEVAAEIFYDALLVMAREAVNRRLSPTVLFLSVFRIFRKFRNAQSEAMQTPGLN